MSTSSARRPAPAARPCGDRDQPFLLPLDVRDWLPDGHLAWFILDVTDQLDLEPFYQIHRTDGHGHPAYDPKLLLGVLLHAYAIGCGLRGKSSDAAARTSPSGCWPATSSLTT